MPTTKNFVPAIWSTKIIRTLEDNLVAKKICFTDHQGDIRKAGDTVYFNGLSDPTINTYAGSVSYETMQDSQVALLIDQQKYFAFKVDDIEKAQENIDKKGSQAERAAYRLREACDSYILGLYGDAKHVITDSTLDSATVISVLGTAQQKLAEENVSDNDMWMVIPPWVRLKMELAGIKFQINNGINGSGGMAWTNQLGFDVYVTNQVVNLGTVNAPQSQVLAGSYQSIAFAQQIMETETIRLESQFADAVRGLHVYGAKVIRPELLVRLNLTFAAETAI
jgi:hypothetical protein